MPEEGKTYLRLAKEDIEDVTIGGNTAMHHLLLGLPLNQLALSPFVPAISRPLDLKARDLGLQLAPGAYVHIPPNIAGFVGSDHVAMLMATDWNQFGSDLPDDHAVDHRWHRGPTRSHAVAWDVIR